jgi:uncharacterized protein
VVIAGVSTRAMAESAARGGFAVTAIDGFADRDQYPGVRALSLPRDFGQAFTATSAATAAVGITGDAIAYLSNLDNHPEAVATLGAGSVLWGNSAEVLRRARNPFVVVEALRSHGLPTPRLAREPAATVGPWLLKPIASGGGHGIHPWHSGTLVSPGHYLQERIEGVPAAIVFVAAAGRVMPLAVSRQLIGDANFGADGFRYCGSILAPAGDPQFARGDDLSRAAGILAQAAASGLGLTGVNGIDFIARDGVPYPIEVNPRWTASVELVERAYGVNVFGMHADACANGELPRHGLHHEPPLTRAWGKAIVFAREACAIDGTDAWLANPDIRDVPQHGERFARGSPVCTVFAEGDNSASCYEWLKAKAARIYGQLNPLTNHES